MKQVKKTKKKFNLYDFFNNREGKGVEKEENVPRNLKFFFKLYWRRISSLVAVNLLLVLGNFPILIGLLGLSGFLNTASTAPVTPLYPFLYGVYLNQGASPTLSTLWGAIGIQGAVSIPTVATYICYGISALTIITFGLVNIGATHLLRSIVRCEPIFYRNDFFGTIKRNIKQGLLLGILDVLAIFALGYGFIFYSDNTGTFGMNLAFYAFGVVAIVYFFMRFYLYLMLITFHLPFRKLLKNAFIFAFVGLKRNILALIGIGVVCFFSIYLLQLYFPVGLMLLLLFVFSTCAFMAVYAAYPKIKEIMIDPVLASQQEENTETDPTSL